MKPLPRYEILNGDSREAVAQVPSKSIDAVICDPPYPEIDRDYGRLSERDWHDLMDQVVSECRRVLKPSGSAVFILQPNSECVGRMRPWLWQFIARYSVEWNLIQDVYWFNYCSLPTATSNQGLLRSALKYCLWFGPSDCYRNQDAVLWSPSEAMRKLEQSSNWHKRLHPSGHTTNDRTFVEALRRRGGVTPLNVLPIPNTDSRNSAGAEGHGAGTPLELCDWWMKYIVPPNGQCLDVFAGSGSTGVAAVRQNKTWKGIEQDPEYAEIAERRVREASQQNRLWE